MSEERPDIRDCRRYFTRFLPGIRGRLLLEGLETLSACFEIEVSDWDEPPWRLGIEHGRLVHVGHDGPEAPCRFRLDSATLLEVVRARQAPAEAFYDLRIEVEGDVALGLELSTVLEPFFRRFPFEA
jgi:predicted lipid carrier protein YhbT